MAERLSTDDLARREPPADDADVATEDLARDEAPADDADVAIENPGATAEPEPQLLDTVQSSELRERWIEIQTGFVDEPRNAVEEADALVADLMRRLAESFSEERQTLESQWDRGDEVSTEDLRVALQRYRAFFDRLLAA
jgi:hypothetical protein